MRRVFTFGAITVLTAGCFVAPNETPIGNHGGGSAMAGGAGGGAAGGTSGGGNAGGSGGGGTGPVELACTPGAWCWQSPLPQGQPLNTVFVASATEAWAGGDQGALLRFKDGKWTPLMPMTDRSYDRIWGSGPSDVWATAQAGEIGQPNHQLFHFDGARWATVSHGALPMVADVSGSASGEVWLISAAHTTTVPHALQRWNGSSFVPAPAMPPDAEPTSLCVRSATEVWATARDSLNSHSTSLYRWDGTAWALQQSLLNTASRRFNSRIGCPADGTAVVEVFDFNSGSYFTAVASGGQVQLKPATYADLVRSAHGEMFSVSGSRVSRWTASGWQYSFDLPPNTSIYSVGFDFLGQTGWLADSTPVLQQWNGSAFSPIATPLPALRALVGPPASAPIAAFGDGIWARPSNGGWTFSPTPTVTGKAMTVEAAKHTSFGAWVVGSAIARYDSVAQTIVVASAPLSGSLLAVDGDETRGFWAVGSQATVLRFDGQQWLAPIVPPPEVVDGLRLTNRTFTAVDVRSANDVMLLANDPAGGRFVSVFYRWNGQSWSAEMKAGTTVTVFDRDPLGNVLVVDEGNLRRRTVGSTTWATLGPLSGWVQSLTAHDVDDIEVTVSDSNGVSAYQYSSAQGLQRSVHLPFPGAITLLRGSRQGTRHIYWAAGAHGAVLGFQPKQ